jgi:ankyrin repeat protein/beta-lactamase regulating signal transducer with metallopeptidase domain
MENYLTQITNYLLTQSWQIAVLVVVIAAATLLLKNKSAHIRYLLWLIVLAKCLVPPLFTIPLAVLPQEKYTEPVPISPAPMPRVAFEAADMDIAKPTLSTSTPVAIPSRPTVTEKLERLTMLQWLALVWIIGAIVFTIAALIKALRTNFWLWQQRKQLPVEIQSGIEDLFYSLDFRTFPKVWMIEGIGQPFVWGLLRGSIYLPADFVKVNSSEHRRSVLGHELSHFLRFDAAVNILQIIAQAVFWFHPFVWWANKKIRAEREKCCDEMAIARLGAKAKDYSDAIVNVLISEHKSTRPVPSLAVAGPVKNIEERIRTMLRPGKKFYKQPSLVAATAVILIALLTVPTALVLTAQAGTKAASTPLHEAATAGDIEQVKSLLSKGVDINAKNEKGNTPLHLVARYGYRQRDMAELLIIRGADVNAKNRDGWTPLHFTAWRSYTGHRNIAELLIAKSADINARAKDGRMPLHYAARSGSSSMVELLLAKGTDLNARGWQGWTALHEAANWTAKSVVELLLAKGADVNVTSRTGWTPLHAAAGPGWPWRKQSTRGQIVGLLIDSGSVINAKDSDGCTPLHAAAAWRRQDEVVEVLLARGANVDAEANSGATPLHYAAYNGQKGVVEILLAKGANINAKTDAGDTPASAALQADHPDIFALLTGKGGDMPLANSLHSVARIGNLAEAKNLIDKGANVNAKDWIGWTALHYTAKKGNRDVIQLLISRGAKVNVQNKDRLTPLHKVTDRSCAEILIAHNADVNAKDNEDFTPLHYAAQQGHEDVVEVLISKGANVNPTNECRKPLHWAVMRGHTSIVKLLIEKGADVNAEDCYSDVPLLYARTREIGEILLDNGANPNARDMSSFTPLHYAAGTGYWPNGSIDMVDLLISKGADVNLINGWGGTALSIAKRKGHAEIADLLRKQGAKE